MFKHLRSFSVVLFLGFLLGGFTHAVATPSMDGVQASQQSGICKGIVKDATGETVIGASVVVKGTTNGTITGLDGDFSIPDVKKGEIIQVSFVGYQTIEVKWDGQPLNILLKEDSEMLEEVVVVGYGVKQKRSTMTTSISKVDNKVLENAAVANAATALQGSVSGLRVTNTSGSPGSSPSIVLRGGATIEGTPGSPLVVVDGVIRSLNDVNASDIESMQVLKDAASTAIYGARANNGVILITTKKGKAGHTQVSYKFKAGMNFARFGYEYMNAEEYLTYARMGANYSGQLSNTQRGYGPENGNFSVKWLEGNEDLLKQGWQQMKDPVSGKMIAFKDYGTQLRDAAYKNPSFTQDHFLSFNGGNDNGTFSASLGYYSEDGVLRGTKYERFSGTLNGNYKVLPILNIKGGVNFSTAKSPFMYYDDESDMFERMQSIEPTWNPFNEDGTPAYGYGKRDGNPLYWLDRFINNNNTRRTTLNIGADLEIIKNKLFLRENSSVYYNDYTNETFNKSYQDFWNNDSNGKTNKERYASTNYERTIQQQHSVQLEYTDTYKEKHNLSVLAGGEYFQYDYLQMKGSGKGSEFDDIPTLNVTSKEGRDAYSNRTDYRIMSYFGRLTYDYEHRYLFTAVMRYDGISKLSDNRWGFFPGVSAGWNIHEEAFYKDSKLADIVSTIKPRVSYGINGNVNGIGNYDVYGVYSSTTAYNGSVGIQNTGVINSKLRWEKSKSIEVGLDLGFMNNRYNLILDYYSRTTSDLLTDLDLPGYTGFGSFKTNLGSLRNTGFEVEANVNLIRNPKGFNWDLSFNTSYVKNKIIKLPYNGTENNRQGGSQIYDPAQGKIVWVGGYQEGQPLGDIYAYKQVKILRDEEEVKRLAGDYIDEIAHLYGPNKAAEYAGKGNWKPIMPGDVLWDDKDGNKTINSLDREKIGNVYPKWTGGFSTTLSYKNVSLYARFDYAVGHTIFNEVAARSLGQAVGFKNIIKEGLKTWTPENPDTDLPRCDYADYADYSHRNIYRSNGGGSHALQNNSSRFYEKGDYLACRELTLSWKLPLEWISKAHMTNASVYVTGQNLFYITGYSGISPEAPLRWLGVDGGRYPTPRTLLLGLSVSF
ncbi:TonB-dependent receptor [Bacteroides sp. OM08-11]|jgi:TonB-linked SusC/RagA family outer membrane protein|nr:MULTISPECIES: TonB-dependent receptor [Bacteroides]RGM49001.1 TonB-dependent receptor [Bacteroides sp. OM08-11]